MKRFLTVILVILLLGILAAAGIVFSVEKISSYIYKEISYQLVADRTVGAEKDREKITLLLFDYIHNQIKVVGGGVVDQDSWNDLLRGFAWCDQQSWAFGTLLAKKNIAARIVMLKDKTGSSPHTVTEVLLNGKWRVFDPLEGLVFRNQSGSLVTLEEISQDFTILSENARVKSLAVEHYSSLISWYKRMFPIPYQPGRWGSILGKKTSTRPRRLAQRAIELAVRLLGEPFVNSYQDLYLLARAKSFPTVPGAVYYKARNYHLYQRQHSAERTYRQIIQDYPQSKRVEDSQYYLGVLLFEVGNYKEAIQNLNELFFKFPDTKWSKLAHYFLARAYEEVGDFDSAKKHYQYADYDLHTDAAWRLSKLP